MKLELKIRNKAVEDKSFPSEAVIEEFLKEVKYPEVSAKWSLPDINAFIVRIHFKNITNIYIFNKNIKYFLEFCFD